MQLCVINMIILSLTSKFCTNKAHNVSEREQLNKKRCKLLCKCNKNKK